MRATRRFTKCDAVVLVVCILLLWNFAAIGGPGRGRAREAVCLSNVGRLSHAWLRFAEEHDGRLVGGGAADYPMQWVGRPVLRGTVEQKLDAIRRGLLFPYVGDVRVYRCSADGRQRDPNVFGLRSFSIAGGANGDSWTGYANARVYSDLANPAERYIFVEEANPRGASSSSWQMNPKAGQWVDPVGMWHDNKSSLGFADGHAETHPWHDRSFIDWSLKAVETPYLFMFGMTPPEDERQDIEYMAMRFPYKALK